MSAPAELMVKQFWPTTFYSRLWLDHSAEAPEIIAHLYRLKAAETARIASGVAPGAKSSFGLFESNFDLFAESHSGLSRLKAFIGQSVQMAAAHANGSQVEPQFGHEVVAAMRAHWPQKVNVWPDSSVFFGGINAVELRADGSVSAVADGRRGGVALLHAP